MVHMFTAAAAAAGFQALAYRHLCVGICAIPFSQRSHNVLNELNSHPHAHSCLRVSIVCPRLRPRLLEVDNYARTTAKGYKISIQDLLSDTA